MHDSYIIHGGKPLVGEVTLSGAKNASIKLMIASLLFDGPTVLYGVPHNGDNAELKNLLHDIGVSVTYAGNTVTVDPTKISKHIVSLLYGSKVRSSFLLFGPLLHRFGEAHIPNPGGCRIGARPIERIIQGIQALNVDVNYNQETGYYEAKARGAIHGEYTFEKQTHTGTEALILLATCGTGEVILHNCALEPEIDDLILFLTNAGANIRREGK
ncbi:UDP-N-acetylglucosamine 1-carboxyvinyltransferase, partial [Candidatus Woesebacteria bacterium]|nr:UDP-N-acetylglucosamine 1-carboxyvinyltransferase [Candidatus Woesebacteria bacterium]